jgi:hypothetical protein
MSRPLYPIPDALPQVIDQTPVVTRIGWGEWSEPQHEPLNNHAEMLGFASSHQPIRTFWRGGIVGANCVRPQRNAGRTQFAPTKTLALSSSGVATGAMNVGGRQANPNIPTGSFDGLR